MQTKVDVEMETNIDPVMETKVNVDFAKGLEIVDTDLPTDTVEFDYIARKIMGAPFEMHPFRHLHLQNLLTPEHLQTLQEFSRVPHAPNLSQLHGQLIKRGYAVQTFPGCAANFPAYRKQFQKRSFTPQHTDLEMKRVGLAYRLSDRHPLVDYFQTVLPRVFAEKFQLPVGETTSVAGIQKYLAGYEISPHPDVREKALTYLLNLENVGPNGATHLCQFKPKYQTMKTLWQTHPQVNRSWVPWSWCTIAKSISNVNEMVVFAPGNDTLHAVDLGIYPHNQYQRTHLYGNMMYCHQSRQPHKPVKWWENKL